MNRREDGGIAFSTIKSVCQVLGLSLDEYNALEVCPKSARYRSAES